MKVRKILAGIDFSKDTESILAYTAHFAKIFRSSVHLLYVIDYLITPPAYLIPYMEQEKKIAGEKFETLKKRLTGIDIQTEAEVIAGRLQESFSLSIKKTSADMLVLGFVTHALRRSSSEKLIKGEKMPMLVVRGRKAESARFDSLKIKKILCPVDLSVLSGQALRVAAELSEVFSAELCIVHVLQDSVLRKINMPGEEARARQELRDKTQDLLKDFLSGFSAKETGTIVEGEPGRAILSYAGKHNSDLIVMGARGLGLIQGMIIGSVTDAVIKSSPCPVLVIH